MGHKTVFDIRVSMLWCFSSRTCHFCSCEVTFCILQNVFLSLETVMVKVMLTDYSLTSKSERYRPGNKETLTIDTTPVQLLDHLWWLKSPHMCSLYVIHKQNIDQGKIDLASGLQSKNGWFKSFWNKCSVIVGQAKIKKKKTQNLRFRVK